MMRALEVPHGRQSGTSALIKHAVRFGRRLRLHGIHHAIFPALVEDGRSACKVQIGKRNVNVFDDGTFTPSLMLPERWPRPAGFDQSAFRAQSNRMHAIYLGMAAHARRHGMKASARADLTVATQERLHHERAR